MHNELFEIALNSEGRRQVPRLFARVKFIFIASIIWSALMLISTLGSLIALSSRSAGFMNQWITTRLLVIYGFTLVNAILVPLQAYFFFGFSRRLRESVEEQDVSKFNDSFRFLISNASLCIVSVIITIAFLLFNILQNFFFSKTGF